MKPKLISLDEAIERLMQSKGCTRRTARRLIERAVQDGRLHYETKSDLKPLAPVDAVRMYDDDPDHLLITLDQLIKVFGYTKEQLLTELSAGRLIAQASEEVIATAKDGGPVHTRDLVVSSTHLLDWIANPDTPPQIVAKFFRRSH
jgi:hypothetical protein